MREPKILAFLQNPWFPPETSKSVVDRYTTDIDFHRRLLARTMSGIRLLDVFGPTMFNEIVWDNVAPVATDTARGVSDIDIIHVEKAISSCKPDLILCFGKLAEEAMDRSLLAEDIDYICCPHPSMRGITTKQLGDEVIRICEWISKWKADIINKEWQKFRASIDKEIQAKIPKELDTPIQRYD